MRLNPTMVPAVVSSAARIGVLIVVAIAAAYPLIWVIGVAFKSRSEFIVDPWGIPETFRLTNYRAVLGDGDLTQYFLNSSLVTVLAVCLVLCLGVPAGYGLARLSLRGDKSLLGIFLLSEMIPATIIIIPILFTYQYLHLTSDHLRLICAYAAGSLGLTVFISRTFFVTVPEYLREAARLDGYGEWSIFRRVMLPLARSPITLIAVFTGVFFWNEFFMALVLVSDAGARTLPLGLMRYQGQYETDWPKIAAAIVISVLPVLTVYAVFQRRVVQGIGVRFGDQ